MTSTDFKQQVYAQETDRAFIVLITLDSDELVEPIRVCDDPFEKLEDLGQDVYGCVSNGETFLFLPFEISLPRDDSSGTVSAKLAIDNIDRTIIRHARSVLRPLTVTIQVILSSDPDFIELEYTDFKLTNVNYNQFTISGDLTLDYWGLEPFPSGRFTPSGFPGLF